MFSFYLVLVVFVSLLSRLLAFFCFGVKVSIRRALWAGSISSLAHLSLGLAKLLWGIMICEKVYHMPVFACGHEAGPGGCQTPHIFQEWSLEQIHTAYSWVKGLFFQGVRMKDFHFSPLRRRFATPWALRHSRSNLRWKTCL